MPRLTQKGQVTIPKRVRQTLGISPGDEVEFRVARNHLVTLVKSSPASPFEKYAGYLSRKAGQDPDRIVTDLRGEP